MKEINKNIFTGRTLLRKYEEGDRKVFADLFTDKEVNFYMGGQKCETREDAYSLFDKCFEIYEGKFRGRHFEIWAVLYENNTIGHIELKQTNNTDEDELEVVYLLDKNFHGIGLMTEILQKINSYAGSHNKKLIATINPDNIKSLKVLEKTGIEKQGWINDADGKTYKIWLKQCVNNI